MIRSISDEDGDTPQMNCSENEEEQPEHKVHCGKTLLIERELSGPDSSVVQEFKVILQLHWLGVVAVGDNHEPIMGSRMISELLKMCLIVDETVIAIRLQNLLFAR